MNTVKLFGGSFLGMNRDNCFICLTWNELKEIKSESIPAPKNVLWQDQICLLVYESEIGIYQIENNTFLYLYSFFGNNISNVKFCGKYFIYSTSSAINCCWPFMKQSFEILNFSNNNEYHFFESLYTVPYENKFASSSRISSCSNAHTTPVSSKKGTFNIFSPKKKYNIPSKYVRKYPIDIINGKIIYLTSNNVLQCSSILDNVVLFCLEYENSGWNSPSDLVKILETLDSNKLNQVVNFLIVYGYSNEPFEYKPILTELFSEGYTNPALLNAMIKEIPNLNIKSLYAISYTLATEQENECITLIVKELIKFGRLSDAEKIVGFIKDPKEKNKCACSIITNAHI